MTAILGRAVIWELNQAALSLKAVSRALTLTVKFVPFADLHGICDSGSKNLNFSKFGWLPLQLL